MPDLLTVVDAATGAQSDALDRRPPLDGMIEPDGAVEEDPCGHACHDPVGAAVKHRPGAFSVVSHVARQPKGVHRRMKQSVVTCLTAHIESIRRRAHSQDGQGMVEYALILVLIAVVVIVILSVVGNQVNNVFSNVSNSLNQ